MRSGRWLRPAAAVPPWRVWDGGLVLYDSLSGDTHLLQAPAGAMFLEVLQRGGEQAEVLMVRHADAPGEARAVLETLLQLGMLEVQTVDARA